MDATQLWDQCVAILGGCMMCGVEDQCGFWALPAQPWAHHGKRQAPGACTLPWVLGDLQRPSLSWGTFSRERCILDPQRQNFHDLNRKERRATTFQNDDTQSPDSPEKVGRVHGI